MALVLRKSVLSKNVTLLKCIKGRPLATTANKKNPAALSSACGRGRSALTACAPPFSAAETSGACCVSSPRKRKMRRRMAVLLVGALVGPVDHVDHVDPVDPVDPVALAAPARVAPVVLMAPVDPVDLAALVDPTAPAAPVVRADVRAPVDLAGLVVRAAHVVPVVHAAPVDRAALAAPVGHVAARVRAAHADPVARAAPARPLAPALARSQRNARVDVHAVTSKWQHRRTWKSVKRTIRRCLHASALLAVLDRSAMEVNRALALGYLKIGKSRLLSTLRSSSSPNRTPSLRFCVSCPNLVPETRASLCLPIRHLSPPRTKLVFSNSSYPKKTQSPFPLVPGLLQTNLPLAISKRAYSKPCAYGCLCPFPCGSCGNACGCSSPPPRNTPPRCIQYMTGYYYYPYGFWFCGPYHVSGTCCPVGPCAASGPCAPCAPCKTCCPPCCVCPATAAVMGGQATKKQPKSGVVPSNHIKCPLSHETAKQGRAGISKYFPFNSAMSPGPVPNTNTNLNVKEPRKPDSPNTPIMSSLICPYSTVAQPRYLSNQYVPDKFCSSLDAIQFKHACFNGSSRPKYSQKPVKTHSSPTAKISSTTFTKYSDHKLKGCKGCYLRGVPTNRTV
ncbi:LOW QUALITY PROTEIN: uncharacterized protein ACR2FA_007320 [Aphomia sociella]